jgi:hypothetical protein
MKLKIFIVVGDLIDFGLKSDFLISRRYNPINLQKFYLQPDNFSSSLFRRFSKLFRIQSLGKDFNCIFILPIFQMAMPASIKEIAKKFEDGRSIDLLKKLLTPQKAYFQKADDALDSGDFFKGLSCCVCNWQDVQLSDNWEILPP